MKLNRIFTLFVLFFVCWQNVYGIAKYKAIPLNYLAQDVQESKQGDLCFGYSIFNAADCQKFLGRDKIIAKGYQPIQISFTNNSDRSLSLDLTTFSFPCVSCYEIAEQIRFDTTKRVLAWGIPGLFIWPFLIPAVMEAIESPKANERLLTDYSQKSLSNQIVRPYSRINGLVFVAQEHFKPTFSFVLIDQSNGKQYTLSTVNQELNIYS